MLLKQNKVLKNGKVILKKEEESSKANTEDPNKIMRRKPRGLTSTTYLPSLTLKRDPLN